MSPSARTASTDTPIRLVIISLLPRDLGSVLDALARRAAEETGSRAALAYPPHLTMRTGALVPPADLDRFVADFAEVATEWSPFELSTTGLSFDSYRDGGGTEKYFIGYLVEAKEELLALHRRLLTCDRFIKGPQYPFRPHLSLAYDDLSADAFRAARSAAESDPPRYPARLTWCCDSVSLYRLDNSGVWREVKTYQAEL